MNTIHDLLDRLWTQYIDDNPKAHAVFQLLGQENQTVGRDHIAFRTLNLPTISVGRFAVGFENFGYVSKGEYFLEEKNLFARHYEHEDPSLPLLFISELMVDELPIEAQDILHACAAQIEPGAIKEWDFSTSGRHWTIGHDDYEYLLEESEYAAWFSAFGFRANHFAVSVNQLNKHNSIESVNAFLKQHDYEFNTSGGEIKGSPEKLLEQSATLAEEIDVEFSDGTYQIPSCYCEFTRRYAGANGELFRGFITESADTMFESTDTR